MGRGGSGSIVLAALVATSAPARADPLDACVAAYDATQRLQHAGKLREAQTQAIACAQDACPPELRKDCLRWAEDVHKSTPSVVVHAVGADGCDLESARVFVDGQLVAQRLEGKAVPLDPGAHTVRVEPESGTPLEQRIVLSEGEKNRVVEARFAPAGVSCRAADASPGPTPPVVATSTTRPTPPLVYVLGAAGVLSLAVASGFYVSALSQKGTLDDCRPRCASAEVDTMRRTYLVGDALLVVGVVSLAAAAVFYLTRGERVVDLGPLHAR